VISESVGTWSVGHNGILEYRVTWGSGLHGYQHEEDISCDSEFMLGVIDRVGKALRESFKWVNRLIKWVKPNEWIYLATDNAGGPRDR
jgi:hypothetical protein